MAKHRFKFPQPTKSDLKLINAAQDGHLDTCLEAISEGARVNAVSHKYQTPLTMAARSQNIDIIRMLLEKDAAIDLVDDDTSPLMEAAYRGNREIVDILLDAGADINAKIEMAHNIFMDVPQFALEGGHCDLAIHLRSLINQDRRKQG